MKKAIALTIALAMCLTALALPAAAADTVTAQPTASTVYIDGRAVTLTSGGAYTAVGSEMAKGDGKAKTASPTQSKIYLDGRELALTVYNIGGSNFFKLRDLMEVLNVYVGYDEPTRAITLDTGRGYGQTDKPPSGGDTINHSIVGIWSLSYVPSSFATTLYNTYTTSTHFVTEMTSVSSSTGGAIFVEVFREDGTGHSVYLDSTTYGWNTFNYRVEGDTIYYTNIIGTHNDKNFPSSNYENKSFKDSSNLFKIRVNSDGEQQLVIKPSFLEGTDLYNMSIDEYIEHSSPSWYTKMEE